MGALMRERDWSATALGPVATWPPSLRTAISIMLESKFAMVIAWGAEFRFFYNDRYRPILGSTKHPGALGTPGAEIFPEVWDVVGPEFGRVRSGEAFAIDDWLLPLDRNGYLENCWFTVSYSPVRDETGSVGGVLAVVAETTVRVESERRLATLRDLARRPADAHDSDEAGAHVAEVLEQNPIDVPFALLYMLDPGGTALRRTASVGLGTLAAGHPAAIETIDVESRTGWPIGETMRAGSAIVLDDLPARFGPLPAGPYSEQTHTAILLPLARPGLDRPYGVLACGVSPRRALDEPYRAFFDLAADHVVTAIGNARAIEEARQRAEKLAELDRAKTAFFANVSHEFRTPLTLMLGPLEETLGGTHGALSPGARAQIEVARRNALRLLKLVNTLLDFARFESDRTDASFEPTDVAKLTAELSGLFHSAVERAGLGFTVDCSPIAHTVYVDRDGWEKIVLNLLSNALKFTFKGSIAVRMAEVGAGVELRVRDTGVGIPEDQVDRVFERFHRVPGAQSRTHEGTGIGLALVQELVRMHGGTIRVESKLGSGSTFVVAIPSGKEHLPADRILARRALASTAISASAFVDEALRWASPVPEVESNADAGGAAMPSADGERARILVVDDNADMREYLARLLRARWSVQTAPDGAAALELAKASPPDLVITDVMMPRLDGFGLLRALREDPRTKGVQVVMLSARAGEEAEVEGLDAGADDYLVKPFGTRELTARVASQLALARTRRDLDLALARESAARHDAEAANATKDEFLAMLGHELRNPLSPIVTALELMRLHGSSGSERERVIIERQIVHLTRLVDDLLDVSRITRGRVELKRRPVETSDVVTKAIEMASPLFEQRSHNLKVDVPARGLRVGGDEHRLAQVVANLLTNAAKYTDRRGTITLRAYRDGAHVVLSVKDTGIGIGADLLPRVFDLFVQGGSTIDRSQGGLGLGLAIVKSLVELHGGTVEAHSEGAQRGSELIVRLPLLEDDSADASRISSEWSIEPERMIPDPVLVVDDNEDAADVLAEALRLAGFEIHVAYDAVSALDVARRTFPRVALLDLGLPVVDGYELARRLRELPGAQQIRLVAVTGYGQSVDRERSLAAGFHAHLVKPVDLRSVEAVVLRLLAPSPS